MRHTHSKVVIRIDMDGKNSHRFSNGTVIRLERQYNEFNKRITEPVNAIVVSAEEIPEGAEVLISHNALHDSNKIYDYATLSGIVEASTERYYSIAESDCFAWRDANGELHPTTGFAFCLRVYKPYEGFIQGIEPTLVPNVLYITTGELKGNICHVLKASDYEIIYQGTNGQEARVIRCRHFPHEHNERQEVVAISHDLTEKLHNNELLAGLSPSTATTLKKKAYAI